MFGVLRIVNARICFLRKDGDFGQVGAETWWSNDRETAYRRARANSGLLCLIPECWHESLSVASSSETKRPAAIAAAPEAVDQENDQTSEAERRALFAALRSSLAGGMSS